MNVAIDREFPSIAFQALMTMECQDVLPIEAAMRADLIAIAPVLRAFAGVLTGNRERADDLVRRTIIQAMTSAWPAPFATSLKVRMVTALRDTYYRDKRMKRLSLRSTGAMAAGRPPHSPCPETDLAYVAFRDAFWRLRDKQREVLILRTELGLSLVEVATVCGCPARTIELRTAKTWRTLRRRLHGVRRAVEEVSEICFVGGGGVARACDHAAVAVEALSGDQLHGSSV